MEVLTRVRRGWQPQNGPAKVVALGGAPNQWTYGSFAPKRHAFCVARREADKQGFSRRRATGGQGLAGHRAPALPLSRPLGATGVLLTRRWVPA